MMPARVTIQDATLQPFQNKRLVLMAFLLFVAFCGLGYRLVDLQVMQHEALKAKANAQVRQTRHIEPRRGSIYDIRTNLLATSRPVKTVFADPVLMGTRQPEIARALAPIFQVPEAELHKRLLPQITIRTNPVASLDGTLLTNRHIVVVDGYVLAPRGVLHTNRFTALHNGVVTTNQSYVATNSPLILSNSYVVITNQLIVATNRHVVLAHKVPMEQWAQITAAMSKLTFGVDEKKLPRNERAFYRELRAKAINSDRVDDQIRIYPNLSLAAHVLGFMGPVTRTNPATGVVRTESAGLDGIERQLDAKLNGVRGWRETEFGGKGGELVMNRQQEVGAQDGLNAVLTLDAAMQHILETELAEIMARYNPVGASAIVLRPRTGEILAMGSRPTYDPNQPGKSPIASLKNRMTVDSYEPGSTFKIVSIGAALNEGLATLGERVDCERGRWPYKGKVLHDHDPLGVLSVEEVMMKSSNIGSAKIGLRLGDQRLLNYLTAFGFGERTGIPLPGEARGQLIPINKWDGLTASRVSIGHSAAATPLQMAMAMAAIANGGKLMRPLLVDRLEDADGKVVVKNHPQLIRQVFKSEVSRQVVETLKRVVSTDGTAEKARLGYYTAAGKTGTAQKIVNGQYSHDKYFSSFIGFFPADNPELLIYVCVDEPDKPKGFYGGQVAAPAFKNIALRSANYLNIRPETAVGEAVTGVAQAPQTTTRTN
ncbi:MAG: penicillin-binding protein 2 [Verrucomicrobia bacterium]|nr:penicillin-binding protein 2 [Verrucomicrobiota bacterium]